MKRPLMFIVPVVLLALLAVPGCRRTDVRSLTVTIEDLSESNRAKAVEALKNASGRFYDGLDENSFVFDVPNHTLTLKYDSMRIAHTNVRMLLADKGFKVVFPENTTGRAGY